MAKSPEQSAPKTAFKFSARHLFAIITCIIVFGALVVFIIGYVQTKNSLAAQKTVLSDQEYLNKLYSGTIYSQPIQLDSANMMLSSILCGSPYPDSGYNGLIVCGDTLRPYIDTASYESYGAGIYVHEIPGTYQSVISPPKPTLKGR